MARPIAISLSPNTKISDVFLSVRMLLSFWRYKRGNNIQKLEFWFRQFYTVSYAISFASGRGALYAILKSLGIGSNDEVIIQAFTCVAVPNAIIATGAKPVYADITNSITIDPEEVERHITPQTKAILVQHTFGIPNNMNMLSKIAKKNKLYLIEDVAHCIDKENQFSGKEQKLGTYGIASIFSFGRDKAFSSVFGGIAITADENLGKKIRQFQRQQQYPSFFWIIQQLFHPIAFFFILHLYTIYIGKVLLIIFQRLHLLSMPVQLKEKKGKTDWVYVKKMPNALAALAVHQLGFLEEFNQNRKELSSLYKTELSDYLLDTTDYKIPYLRFPIFVQNRDEVLLKAKSKNIYLGKWYADVIDPKGVSFESVFYTRGSCPKAEYIAKTILNLPTYQRISEKDAKKVISFIKKYAIHD